MQNEKVDALVDRLIEKTEAGSLRWKEGVRVGTYQLSFPDYSVIIEGPADLLGKVVMKDYSIRILDEKGDVAVNIMVPSLALIPSPSNSSERALVDAPRLQRLLEAARRSIFEKKEKVLDELLSRLS